MCALNKINAGEKLPVRPLRFERAPGFYNRKLGFYTPRNVGFYTPRNVGFYTPRNVGFYTPRNGAESPVGASVRQAGACVVRPRPCYAISQKSPILWGLLYGKHSRRTNIFRVGVFSLGFFGKLGEFFGLFRMIQTFMHGR